MRTKKTLWVGLVVVVAMFLLAALVIAQSGGTTLLWDSLAVRGRSTGGGYTLSDSVGEPFGGVASGGGFTVRDGGPLGASGGTAAGGQRIYLPTILRGQ